MRREREKHTTEKIHKKAEKQTIKERRTSTHRRTGENEVWRAKGAEKCLRQHRKRKRMKTRS